MTKQTEIVIIILFRVKPGTLERVGTPTNPGPDWKAGLQNPMLEEVAVGPFVPLNIPLHMELDL